MRRGERIILEKSNIISINKKLPTQNIKENNTKGEYSLKNHLFDPSKSSPPNQFIIKLQERMNVYSPKNYDINDIKCETA
jgi:hypothetical protein